MPALLECEELTIAVNGRTLLERLTLALRPGALLAVLGPNGVGKTLTLHTLAGIRARDTGSIRLRGDEPGALTSREIALRVGLLLQHQEDPFPTTVLETAVMGRHARLGLWQWETSEDIERARTALRAMDLEGLESRPAASLSGGERRRLALATLLVQDPDVLLLDEPMNHLDPLHQFSVLDQLRSMARDGRAVVASLHDPTLAARFFERVLLLFGDGRWQLGPAEELLTAANLATLYRVPFAKFTSIDGAVMLPSPAIGNVTPLRLTLPKARP
jgi:iron complex transport system ATP-binding protein